MKRKRIVTILLAIACVVMAGVTLHQFRVSLVSPVSAQDGDSQPGGVSPLSFGPMKAASPSIRKAATAAIHAQLQAFQKDDYQTAVKYQSSNLKHRFHSVAHFRQTITSSFPEFAHYKSVQFQHVQADPRGRYAVVQVTLTGQDGVTINALYFMVRESGGYKVDGVVGGGHAPLPAAPGARVDA